MKTIRMNLLLLGFFIACIFGAGDVHASKYADDLAALAKQKTETEAAVKAIVNQPVQSYPINTFALLHVVSPGWFKGGAAPPNYNADVRKTQEYPYDKTTYVTSDVTPGLMFKSTDTEYNENLRYYYTDRTQPKKRLTNAEMVEINRLYHIINYDNKKTEEMQGFVYSTTAQASEFMNSLMGTALQLVLLTGIGFFAYRKWFA